MIRYNGKTGEWEIYDDTTTPQWQIIDRMDALRYMEQDAEGCIGEFTLTLGDL